MQKRTAHIWGGLLIAASLALTGCGNSADSNDSNSPTTSGSTGDGGALEKLTIGTTQIVEHPSLDAAREGFKQAFYDAGYVEGDTIDFDEQNAQGEMATATAIASKFQSDGVDLILAVATPTAQAAFQAVPDIPILFTAVTEPVEAGLAETWEAPGDNATGTSDLNPVADQIGLIKEIAPDAQTVGVIYSSGEVNSEVQVKLARTAAADLGMTLKEVTISAAADVSQAAQTLSDVDAIYVPTDNAVVEGLEAVIQVAEANKIPLIVGEGDSVERGGLATYGINYTDLGYQTGLMALRILQDGTDPASMGVETLDKIELVINTAAAQRMGVTLSEDLIAKADNVVDK